MIKWCIMIFVLKSTHSYNYYIFVLSSSTTQHNPLSQKTPLDENREHSQYTQKPPFRFLTGTTSTCVLPLTLPLPHSILQNAGKTYVELVNYLNLLN